jgi:hypothetical protein
LKNQQKSAGVALSASTPQKEVNVLNQNACHCLPYLKGPGNCYLQLEVHQAQGLYRGDTRFACFNLDLEGDVVTMMAERSLVNADPDTAILAGKVENDAIHLKATKSVGANWCAISDLILTPGGSQLIAEWKDCNGGHLNLQRGAR